MMTKSRKRELDGFAKTYADVMLKLVTLKDAKAGGRMEEFRRTWEELGKYAKDVEEQNASLSAEEKRYVSGVLHASAGKLLATPEKWR